MNFYLLIAFYVVICGLGVGIFLWGKPDGNSMFDRLYRLVCVHVPWAIKKVLEKCCGKRGPAALDAAWTYVCYTSNPIVQIFYLGVVVGGYLTFVGFGYPHLPNRLVGSIHKYTGFAVFSVCVGVWWRACTTDPGTVTPLNVDELCKFYVWDDIIFEKASCKTCGQLKPARSKHCSLCNVCVARFDHHCIWLNNCVGVGNHKWFLTFLFSHLVLCFYGMAMGTVIIYDIVQRKDLLSAVFVDPVTRQKHPATYLIVLQYMLATEAMVIFVALLCLVMGLVLCGFFIWHLNLVRTGVTTNELNKWNFVKWQLRQEGEDQKAKELTNIYNKGLRANFREVFANIDVHQLPGRQATSRATPSNNSKEDRVLNKSGGGGKKGKSKKS